MHSLAPARTARCAQGVERQLLRGTEWWGCRVDAGTLCRHGMWWILSDWVDHPHNSCAVHVGAQPTMGGGDHWRQPFRQILDSQLRSRGLKRRPDNNGGERRRA